MSDKSESLNIQLANAVARLAQAQECLERMRRVLEDARREENAALNKVNEEQKHFDDLTAQVKSSAPKGSDWKRPIGVPV